VHAAPEGEEDVTADSPPNGLIVMYHYVRKDASIIPSGIRPLLESEFEAQLDWLCERYCVVGPEEFVERVSVPQTMEKPPCLLTFDDGLKDHADVVLPILAQRNLAGLFFVLTWPTEFSRMPVTHLLHWLLGQDEEWLWGEVQRFARQHLGSVGALGNAATAEELYYYESSKRARIKFALNLVLPSDLAEEMVADIARRCSQESGSLAAEWFLSTEQIIELDAAGMTIGIHGCSHRSLQTLGDRGIGAELSHGRDYLAELVGSRSEWFSCPFGGSGASPELLMAMRRSMTELGVPYGVSIDSGFVGTDADLLFLPRFDTIQLPPRAELVG